jgi:eukaryotic-like serine/threonine-protein kinase
VPDVPLSPLAEALRHHYLLERELGRGGMATVWLARDVRHRRPVAVKVLRPELGAILGAERFLREIQLTASLQHPHILPLLDSGEAGGLLYYVMPYVEGESLRHRLQHEGQLPLDDALRLTREVAEALAYAHGQGIIHRDIKPENILISRGHALVADFGIALAVTQAGGLRLTETGLSLGTPAYMSPEQASADARLDGRSDQYSLACVLYEMLAGEPPYTGPTAQAIMAKRLGEPVPHLGTMRQVPQAVEAGVTWALARAPADRYQTVSQFAQALANAALTGTADLPARHLRRSGMWWTSAAALALLTLSIGSWGVSRARTEAATRRGVALLPCENTNPRQEEAYIGDRWSEELIQKLVRVGGLNPKAWESVSRYRGSRLGVRQIGADLNAGTLVRCQVAEQPTGVRLSVDLIRAQDERVIWSNDYERPAGADGINAAQSAAARDIAQELGAHLPPRAVAALERPLTKDTVALRLYRLGKHFLQSVDDPSSVRKSVDYFERAIGSDSNLAHAYVGLAEAMYFRGERESRVSRDYYPAAARLVRRAIALDPTIAEAHTFLARYLLDYTHDWIGAEDEHRRALALNPSSVDVHLWYGWHLQTASRFEEAIAEFDRAVELDPANWLPRAQLIRALAFAGNERRATRELREALELAPEPEREVLYHHWAVMLLRRGERDSAVAVLDRHVRTPEWYDAWLYAAAGRRDNGQRMLDSLLVLNESRPVDPAHIAALQVGLGNTEEALKWLDRAYADRSALLLFLLGPHPAFDALRGDPRFQELRKKVGFKQ